MHGAAVRHGTHMFDLQNDLDNRRASGLLRRRLSAESAQGVRMRYDGRDYLSFCSNDYLGLASHPDLQQAACDAARQWGTGAGASHLLGGHSQVHDELEQALADFAGTERALLFSTGYMANLGVLAGLVGRGGCIHQDRLNHASLIDGGLLSRARLQRYPHGDHARARKNLAVNPDARQILATDGVFSMDGDVAPLAQLISACRDRDALCYIDDAHGLGVIGPQGRGALEVSGIQPGSDEHRDCVLLMGTLGKAFGSFGAFVAGSGEWIETLVQQARTYIYTTALPPAQAAVSLASVEIVKTEHWRREHLAVLIDRFRAGCRERGIELMASDTPIQPVMVSDNQKALDVAEHLRRNGLMVFAIRQPTVPAGSERLRITFSASHAEADVDRLLDGLEQAGL